MQRQLQGEEKSLLVDRTRQLVKQTFTDRLADTKEQNQLLSDDYIESILVWAAEHRIARISELIDRKMKFVWLSQHENEIDFDDDTSIDCGRVLSEITEKLRTVEKYNEDDLKEVLLCYGTENGLSLRQYMGLLRKVLGGDQVPS